jgi:predicted DNA-binding protein (MmcQ/YjbR family)
MDITALREICTSFPEVTEDIKWENHLCFCVGGKMFVVLGMDESPVTASFKTSDENFEYLSNRPGMKPAPYLARYKWIFIDDISRMGKKEWEEYAGDAYKLIAGKLPKTKTKVRGTKSEVRGGKKTRVRGTKDKVRGEKDEVRGKKEKRNTKTKGRETKVRGGRK